MLRTVVILALALQLCGVAVLAAPRSDELAIKLGKQISNYNLGVFNFVGALIQVSNDFRIPMGIVWVDSPAARTQLPFAWKHATVEEIIQSIAKTQRDYRVEIKGGSTYLAYHGRS